MTPTQRVSPANLGPRVAGAPAIRLLWFERLDQTDRRVRRRLGRVVSLAVDHRSGGPGRPKGSQHGTAQDLDRAENPDPDDACLRVSARWTLARFSRSAAGTALTQRMLQLVQPDKVAQVVPVVQDVVSALDREGDAQLASP